MLKNKNNYSGFSLLELIMVITIMGIMSSVGFVSLQSSKVDSRLKAAQGEVSATIKLAQSYALQGKMRNIGGVDKTPCGYGFRFTSTSAYEIFYNTPASGDCDTFHGVQANCHYKAGTSVTLESGTLNNSVTLTSPNVANIADTEIYFKIPFGVIYGGNGNAFVQKTFTFSYGGSSKNIVINPNGSVDE